MPVGGCFGSSPSFISVDCPHCGSSGRDPDSCRILLVHVVADRHSTGSGGGTHLCRSSLSRRRCAAVGSWTAQVRVHGGRSRVGSKRAAGRIRGKLPPHVSYGFLLRALSQG